jgi:hypothetical protein
MTQNQQLFLLPKAHLWVWNGKEIDYTLKMKGVKKQNLPTKICLVCQKPFAWRKKWEKVWDEVKYCSDKCRKAKLKD